VGQLQREWAAHLNAAAAAGTMAQGAGDSNSCRCSRLNSSSSDSGSHASGTLQSQPQQHQHQPGLQRLQQLLAANAAVPASQLASLRQLDLSLEQLLDLQGLGQLCPQLTVSRWC
jgi:hypothetical protein